MSEASIGVDDMALQRILLIALLLAGLPAAAIGQSFSERTGINSLLGISPSTQDFVNQVTLNEMFAQELARLASERGGEKIKAFAEQILKDHKETSAHMRALVLGGSVKVPLPTELSEAHLKELARLRSLGAPEFDKEFESLQAELHEDAISLFERYGVRGEHPDLKRFAFRHLPEMREHWRMAQNLARQ
jgi:putative membrane protein